jgi:hypothetical protein
MPATGTIKFTDQQWKKAMVAGESAFYRGDFDEA